MAETDSMTISLWLGNFPSKEDLKRYVGVKASNTAFLKDYKIRRIDPDFVGSDWFENVETLETLLSKTSYSEYYIDMIKERHPELNPLDYNSTILLLGEYEGDVAQTENTIFLGTYSFEYVNPYI